MGARSSKSSSSPVSRSPSNDPDIHYPIHWGQMAQLAAQKRLSAHLLAHIPPRVWGRARCESGMTLLYLACEFQDESAMRLLLRHGVDSNVRDHRRWCNLHRAVVYNRHRVAQVLLAGGAGIHELARDEFSPLSMALIAEPPACVALLLANGARLEQLRDEDRHDNGAPLVMPWMVAFQAGVLRCRAVAIALLGIKRRRGPALRGMDRFVVRLVALDIWATRMQWSPIPANCMPGPE